MIADDEALDGMAVLGGDGKQARFGLAQMIRRWWQQRARARKRQVILLHQHVGQQAGPDGKERAGGQQCAFFCFVGFADHGPSLTG